jgi:hypothetical protein
MLHGFNTNISCKGTVYHIQTEDNGLTNPVITTLVYAQGQIIASKKTGYADIAEAPDCAEKVAHLMEEQHHSMIEELIEGKHNGVSSDEKNREG